MSSPYLPDEPWNQAAHCYELSGRLEDAGRCYANARQFAQAARVYRAAGNLRAAARMENSAGRHVLAAWIYVHELRDVGAARTSLQVHDATNAWSAEDETTIEMRRRLVGIRCALAEGAPADTVLAVLADVQNRLATSGSLVRPIALEEWAVAVAEVANRFDQAALTYAAAVRGGDASAAERWHRWALARFGHRIVIPPATPVSTGGAP